MTTIMLTPVTRMDMAIPATDALTTVMVATIRRIAGLLFTAAVTIRHIVGLMFTAVIAVTIRGALTPIIGPTFEPPPIIGPTFEPAPIAASGSFR